MDLGLCKRDWAPHLLRGSRHFPVLQQNCYESRHRRHWPSQRPGKAATEHLQGIRPQSSTWAHCPVSSRGVLSATKCYPPPSATSGSPLCLLPDIPWFKLFFFFFPRTVAGDTTESRKGEVWGSETRTTSTGLSVQVGKLKTNFLRHIMDWGHSHTVNDEFGSPVRLW